MEPDEARAVFNTLKRYRRVVYRSVPLILDIEKSVMINIDGEELGYMFRTFTNQPKLAVASVNGADTVYGKNWNEVLRDLEINTKNDYVIKDYLQVGRSLGKHKLFGAYVIAEYGF